ncbi:hypothetical protein AJ85_02780 [Alkalihalobacillus alcalophilus ATCC 27647 = CGMCC 1.3604]|uniref:Uncharacterized protein n=1 Tax=Alkalihalobacillus alcalophilus ATCC 27647 = CGMCC 1.3604 TaxID=1218173 RepID=A0A4V6S0N9_ALKAL|nr:hypothetical protein AJ85_02780 [Alkalihalobacillus alcalophilus ATCC 27647 = CGMCC 1.3604]
MSKEYHGFVNISKIIIEKRHSLDKLKDNLSRFFNALHVYYRLYKEGSR